MCTGLGEGCGDVDVWGCGVVQTRVSPKLHRAHAAGVCLRAPDDAEVVQVMPPAVTAAVP